MKKLIRISTLVLLILFCLNSCTKEETGQEIEETKSVGKLSFGSVLSDLANRTPWSKQSQDTYEIPECSIDVPLFVRVALKVKNDQGNWEWFKDSNQNKIEIEVNPNGSDINDDGELDAWFTQESSDLELEEGEYSLEYFAVASASGNDPSDIIYMAPRRPQGELDYTETIQYHNFVKKPLPLQLKIRPGVKYYQPVEVLCYEEHYAFAFGYLFFDFETTNLIYLCTYGNECGDDQKHIPAQFEMKVWSGDSDQGDLLVVTKNERKSFQDENGTHYYANALCFPLPEIDQYYAKIWLTEDDNEVLVREGSFSASELVNIYKEEQEHYYYHFREGCCDTEDEYSLLTDLTENEGACEEIPPVEEDCGDCEGKINKLSFLYSGPDNTQIIVVQKAGGNNVSIEIFDQTLNNGDEFTIVGEYSQNQNQPNSLWTEIYITEGQNDAITIHTSCSDPEIVPGYTTGNFEIISGESTVGGLICPPTE